MTLAIGACVALLGTSIKCVKTDSNNKSTNTENQKNNTQSSETAITLQNNSASLTGLNQSNTTSVENSNNTPKNIAKPQSQPLEHPTESARNEVIKWLKQHGNRLGQGRYEEVIKRTKEIAMGLPSEELTLHIHRFRYGFTFFYMEREGEKKYIPISFSEGS